LFIIISDIKTRECKIKWYLYPILRNKLAVWWTSRIEGKRKGILSLCVWPLTG